MRELSMTLSDGTLEIRRSDGTRIISSCAGSDGALSATELLAASLGSCMAASLLPLLQRHDIAADALRIHSAPAGVTLDKGLKISVLLPRCDDAFLQRCRRAVAHCPVGQALNIPLHIDWRVA